MSEPIKHPRNAFYQPTLEEQSCAVDFDRSGDISEGDVFYLKSTFEIVDSDELKLKDIECFEDGNLLGIYSRLLKANYNMDQNHPDEAEIMQNFLENHLSNLREN